MEDMISRQALCEYALNQKDKSITPNDIMRFPSAQPEKRTDKCTETHSCDLISRQTAIAEIARWIGYIDEDMINRIQIGLNRLPSAQPQRTGRWIDHVEDGYVECPFCHSATNCDDNISELHFCFSCGADMRGKQDG